jgi:hypothetical protein
MIKRTSDGLRDLLIRHGVTPTMDSKKDVELARKFMPKGYNMSNWISVDDRLPPNDTAVLCFTACRNIIVGGQLESEMYSGNRSISWDLAFNHDVVITHWMHLPEPPKQLVGYVKQK